MPEWIHWKRKGSEPKDQQRPGTPSRPTRHNAKKPSYASGRSDFSELSVASRKSVSSSYYDHDEAITPSKGDYALEATKKTLDILHGVAGLVPFPLVQEVIELGITLIGVCETVGEVQGRVQELQARITEFLLVIAKAASDGEKVINNLTTELEGMKTCLVSITHRLEKISKQNKFLLALFPQPSQRLIDQCGTEFQDSIQRFQVLRGIHAAQDLNNIQAQIEAIYGIANKGVQELTGEVRDVKVIVGRVEDSVAELKSMMKFKAPTHSVIVEATMPDPPEFFFGRDEIVTKIATQLASGDHKKTRVCILGPGGAGKTSTAVTIMNHPAVTSKFAEHHRYWMPCIGANSPGAFLLHLAEQLRATGQPDNPLSAILSTLQESHEPRVILLDNFETVWRPGEGSQEEVKKILRSLNSLPHLAILMTMRSSFPPIDSWTSENLLEVASEDSRRIYTAIDPSAEGHPDLGKLLDTLGHLPYAVTLMATRGKRSSFDPKRLLDEWERRGPAVLSRGLDGMDHSIELSIEDPMLQQTPDAKKLLQVLSLLPAGLYSSDLPLWAPSFDSDAIDILRDTALVATRPVEIRGEQKLHIFVLPVVQSYMRHGRIEESVRQEVYRACFAFLSKHKVLGSGPNDSDFKSNVPAITAQETNIHALVTHFAQHAGDTHFVDPTLLSSQLDGLIAFAWYQAWTRPQPDIGELVVNFARKTRNTSKEAEALFCLAQTLYKIQRFEDARRAYAEVAKLYRSLGDHLLACRSDLSVIQCMQSLGGSFPELEKLINEAQRRYSGDHFGQEAQAWLDLVKANTSRIKGGLDNAEALRLYRNAQTAFSELQCRREAAVCQQSVSKCLAHEGNYAEAIKEWDGAAHIFEEIGLPSGIFRISKVRYLKASDQWGEELTEALRAALEHSQVFGSPMNVAQALEEFAEVYVRSQDWAAAQVAYEGALVQCRRGTGYTLAKIERRCTNNLKFIEARKAAKGDDTKDETKLMTPSRF